MPTFHHCSLTVPVFWTVSEAHSNSSVLRSLFWPFYKHPPVSFWQSPIGYSTNNVNNVMYMWMRSTKNRALLDNYFYQSTLWNPLLPPMTHYRDIMPTFHSSNRQKATKDGWLIKISCQILWCEYFYSGFHTCMYSSNYIPSQKRYYTK